MKRADFHSDTAAGVWAKSDHMLKGAKAHLWRPHPNQRMGDYSVSACCMTYPTFNLRSADEHTQRCKTCAKFCVAVSDEEKVRGVAIVGRPVSRALDDSWTLEVNRCCTDGASELFFSACMENENAVYQAPDSNA